MSSAELLVRSEGVSAGYGAGPVLRDVSFSLHAGERIGVIGPNGAGKSSLLGLILGDLEPTDGKLHVATRPATVSQTDRSRLDFPVSALDVVLMGALPSLSWWRPPGRLERSRARECIASVGLSGHADATFGELSGGQRQRIRIARALMQQTRILLLDEPFTGLDAQATEELVLLLERLAGEGHGLIVVTHDLDHARRCDQVLLLDTTQRAFGPPESVLASDGSLGVVYARYGVQPQ